MKNDNYLDLFDSKQKAIDHAMWLNFKYRISKIKFGVIHDPNNNWAVCEEATAQEMKMTFLDVLPKDYSNMNYPELFTVILFQSQTAHYIWQCSKFIFLKSG